VVEALPNLSVPELPLTPHPHPHPHPHPLTLILSPIALVAWLMQPATRWSQVGIASVLRLDVSPQVSCQPQVSSQPQVIAVRLRLAVSLRLALSASG